MTHNRKLVLGGVALTLARNNRHDIRVMAEIMDDLEREMSSSGYLRDAPFKWIGLILRYGLKNDEEPSYLPINKKHGDLPVAIELDARELQRASRDELKELFTIATLKVLVHIGNKYDLPCGGFAKLLQASEAVRAGRLESGPEKSSSAS